MNFSQEEKEVYEDQLKWLRIEANSLKKYEQKGMEKLAIAKSMLEKGRDLRFIQEVTGLSRETIATLIDSK